MKNATIIGTMLGCEDHGVLTCYLTLEYETGAQGFGGWCFGAMQGPVTSAFGMEFIRQVLLVAGVEKWEDLKGRPVRVDATPDRVHAIGHYVKDVWFRP